MPTDELTATEETPAFLSRNPTGARIAEGHEITCSHLQGGHCGCEAEGARNEQPQARETVIQAAIAAQRAGRDLGPELSTAVQTLREMSG